MSRGRLFISSGVVAGALLAAGVTFAGDAVQADGRGPSPCAAVVPGATVAWVAQNFGNSGTHNPGNAQSPFPPYVPGRLNCNPTDNPQPPS
jgi:hypothetical protein